MTQSTALQRWREMIKTEHAQSDHRRDLSISDQWSPFASRFRPFRESSAEEDPQFQAIARHVQSDHTVLDVGAGGGRLAIPLAQRSAHVTAVEPSESMANVLTEAADRAGVSEKVTLVPSTWEEATVEPADIVLCSHVLYTVSDIDTFVKKLEEHARQRVMVLLFANPPIAHARPFWEYVHQEERLQLPALSHFVQVLWEMGTFPDVEMLTPRTGGRFRTREDARNNFLARLYIRPGSPEEQRLDQAMNDLLEEDPETDGVRIRNAQPQRPGLITWTP